MSPSFCLSPTFTWTRVFSQYVSLSLLQPPCCWWSHVLWHEWICYLIACLFVKLLSLADVSIWKFRGQHLYTNSWLHHCSAFDLVLMGHCPGHAWSSKSELGINFLLFSFQTLSPTRPPPPKKTSLVELEDLMCILGFFSHSAFFSLLLLLLPLTF